MEKAITKICVLSDNNESTVETLLKKSFPGVSVDTLSSEGNYLHYIQGKNYSIILSECSLRNKNSLDVLAAIKKMGCEVPVIVLGECENEEIAIESMRALCPECIISETSIVSLRALSDGLKTASGYPFTA